MEQRRRAMMSIPPPSFNPQIVFTNGNGNQIRIINQDSTGINLTLQARMTQYQILPSSSAYQPSSINRSSTNQFYALFPPTGGIDIIELLNDQGDVIASFLYGNVSNMHEITLQGFMVAHTGYIYLNTKGEL